MIRPSILPFVALSFVLSMGCNTSSVLVPEYMTVSPKSLVFANPDTLHTVALTHSCTCPISWTILKPDSVKWIHVNSSAVGDQGKFPVSIDRSLLVRDTSISYLFITTGEYKTQSGNSFDTVVITAFR